MYELKDLENTVAIYVGLSLLERGFNFLNEKNRVCAVTEISPQSNVVFVYVETLIYFLVYGMLCSASFLINILYVDKNDFPMINLGGFSCML